MAIHARSASLSHKGNIREINEDAFYGNDELGLWCIADGMGGYEAGDVAAAMAVEVVAGAPRKDEMRDQLQIISTLLKQLNYRLVEDGESDDHSKSMMGCTILVVLTDHKQCGCLWAGDSRLYLYRDQFLYQMSKDHSLVQELADQGVISDAERATHPKRHVITRAVGAHLDLALEHIYFDLLPNDRLLLCSDGLYSELSADQIMAVLANTESAQVKAQQLIDQVLSGSAGDNVTVSVIEMVEG